MSRAPASRYARRLCLGASLVLAALFALRAAALDYALERDLWLSRATGYAALGALFLSLLMTPLRRLAARLGAGRSPAAPWLAYRRSFGIAAALWASAHAALSLVTDLDMTWAAVWAWPHLRAGAAGLAILLPLLLTSFPRLVGALHLKLWTPLHRLVYLAPVFLFLHLMQSPFAPRRLTLFLFAALLMVSALRLLPRRRRPAVEDGTEQRAVTARS